MKKFILLFSFLISSCALFPPTPNDFPPPPTFDQLPPPVTVIAEIPNVSATPVNESLPRPILQSDMSAARAFLLIVKTQLASGDDYGFAERVHYPINVEAEGKMKIFMTSDELAEALGSILNSKTRIAIFEINEEDLLLFPAGVRVGRGELWFNLFCMDAACSDTQFLVTQINF